MLKTIAILSLTIVLCAGSRLFADPPADVNTLIKQLGDHDVKVRTAAADALVQMGPAVLPALKQAANGNDVELKVWAQATISRIPADDKQALIAQLGDHDVKVRQDAANKLVQMGAAAIPALRDATMSPNPEIAVWAQATLSRIQPPAADPVPPPVAAVPQPMARPAPVAPPGGAVPAPQAVPGQAQPNQLNPLAQIPNLIPPPPQVRGRNGRQMPLPPAALRLQATMGKALNDMMQMAIDGGEMQPEEIAEINKVLVQQGMKPIPMPALPPPPVDDGPEINNLMEALQQLEPNFEGIGPK